MVRNRDPHYRVARRLTRLRAALGPSAGDAAARACLVAIARVALALAEARSKSSSNLRERREARGDEFEDSTET